ncbi:hypothetical protein M0811_07261 [Anaeramoeba ignava]|uniref:Uncharacterized protein n=1 Tax=Anaeramoeba ignava TaxID=1746090 RepID=A0A9Q0LKR8_ANAIG|nr:hypothetical protein M0811_07261 [Anaeramoeba ignava]
MFSSIHFFLIFLVLFTITPQNSLEKQSTDFTFKNPFQEIYEFLLKNLKFSGLAGIYSEIKQEEEEKEKKGNKENYIDKEPKIITSEIPLSLTEENCSGYGQIVIVDNQTQCACPLDRVGYLCQLPRKTACSVEMISPELSCKLSIDGSKNKGFDGAIGLPCLIYDPNAIIQFEFLMNCNFSEENNQTVENVTFDYFVKNPDDSFALSREPKTDQKLSFKIFNFNQISDDSFKFFLEMLNTSFIGQTGIFFNLSVHDIPNYFYTGFRLYFESKSNLPESQSGIYSQFIDITGKFAFHENNNKSKLKFLFFLLLIPVIAFFVIFFVIRKKKAKSKIKIKTS